MNQNDILKILDSNYDALRSISVAIDHLEGSSQEFTNLKSEVKTMCSDAIKGNRDIFNYITDIDLDTYIRGLNDLVSMENLLREKFDLLVEMDDRYVPIIN